MARRRTLLRAAASGLALSGLAARAQAAWPSRPVRIVVPFAAGGPADVYARAVGQKLQEMLGQPFVIEDRPGAGSVVGTDYAAKSPPDGYTLLLMSNAHTVNETLIPNKPFVLTRDFSGVAPINFSDLVLVAHPSVPVNNLKDLLRLAKERPGKLNYASSGPGTPYHMAGELLKSMAGIHLVHIPYRGSSAARTDVLGGQVDLMFDAVTTMAEHVRAGKVRALGTTGLQRSTVLPEVPTLDEAGVPKYEATIWLGLEAPHGTPRPVIDKLNEAVTHVTALPEIRQLWARQGATPLFMGAAAFDKYIENDIAKWARLIRSAGIKVD
ncbi:MULTISPECIES: tripartite tricarboxylate transporter substrate binding protein [Ramlibacter]|uniref:Tripartite tricarboxylate transporter substrate binding protein n=1 Tax=Ramlibacter aquaticus TaxID=2780094 RepID=A0ABR9SGT9_9BURK|nr:MULTISPECIES: tripartite tricarboxylate transporter substrate binding protein [Ramlibacter]MBE7941577.1 tripartite tricarboxylate transporter substrate binding protein [Ramlibacter aquaticus]